MAQQPSDRVEFTQDDRANAQAYAEVTWRSHYNRRAQGPQTRQENVRQGKLAEMAFVKYLERNGKEAPSLGDILRTENVGRPEIKTADNRTINVHSTAVGHHWLLVPHDQLENAPHDLYVGARVDADEAYCLIEGWCTREELENAGMAPRYIAPNFRAYGIRMDTLHPAHTILPLMQDA